MSEASKLQEAGDFDESNKAVEQVGMYIVDCREHISSAVFFFFLSIWCVCSSCFSPPHLCARQSARRECQAPRMPPILAA